MTVSKSTNKNNIIAAICFGVCALVSIIGRLSNLEAYSGISALSVIWWIILIGFAAALFLNNVKAVTIVAGANALLDAYYLIMSFTGYNLMYVFADGALIVMLILALKGKTVVKKIWYIAGVVMSLEFIIVWLIIDNVLSSFSINVVSIVSHMVEIAAFYFVGLWLKGNCAKKTDVSVNEYATFDQQSVTALCTPVNEIGGADKILMLKNLLDRGDITQEDFDTKKKQILRL